MRRFIRTAATVASVCLLAVVGPAASAPPAEPPGLGIAANATGTVTQTGRDTICEQARGRSGERGPCAAQLTGGASLAVPATPAQLAAAGNLVSPSGRKLLDFVKTTPVSTIWTRTWWQEARGLYYINWWEKHTGRIYYHDGNHVWSTGSAHGYTGNHVCDQGGGIGYDVRVTSCFTERLSTAHINEWDYFKVYVFFKGFPLSASHNMHASAWGSGNIYFYW